jgi:hypothetical protein
MVCMETADQSRTTASRRKNTIGGVADKLGNKYELSWAILYALRCIQDEQRSITFEDLDPDLAEGSEFTFVDEHGTIAVTQVKRQHSVTDHWTVAQSRYFCRSNAPRHGWSRVPFQLDDTERLATRVERTGSPVR